MGTNPFSRILLMLKRVSQLLCPKIFQMDNFLGNRKVRVQPRIRRGLEYQISLYIYSNRFQMDIFLGKFNRVSEEGYEKFLTGLNLNYLLRLSTNEVVVVMYLVRVMIMRRRVRMVKVNHHEQLKQRRKLLQ